MKKLLLVLILSISSFASYAIENEDYYSKKFCNEMSGQPKYHLKDLSSNGEEITSSYPDCLTDTHVFEVDWAEGMKVYEAIGQSLYYSSVSGKKPGILLLIRKENSEKHIEKVQKVNKFHDLGIRIMTLNITTEEISELSE